MHGLLVITCIMQVTGGRNGYGAKLTNIFSTEFTIETCDGHRSRRYKQVVYKQIKCLDVCWNWLAFPFDACDNR